MEIKSALVTISNIIYSPAIKTVNLPIIVSKC